MAITTTTTRDGQKVNLVDLDNITPPQAYALAEAMTDLLVRSGMIRADAPIDGPSLLQFAEELGDYLEQQAKAAAGNEG